MSTPYYLRGIIKCKQCCLPLVARDNSPKDRPGEYRVYRCSSCKSSARIKGVHDAVSSDLIRKWHTQLATIVITSKKQLESWYNKLNNAKADLKQMLEIAIYNKSMSKNEIASNPLLKETFTVARKKLADDITHISTTLEEIKKLTDDNYLDVFLKEMVKYSFSDFTNTELRVFHLMFFDEITINFEKNKDIQLSYRLSPFVLLENMTGQVTEQVEKFEDLTS